MSLKKIVDIITITETKIRSENNQLLNNFPVKKYIELIHNLPHVSDYTYMNKDLDEFYKSVLANSNEHVFAMYQKLLLITLIQNSMQSDCISDFPEDIKSFYLMNFDRIFSDVENNRNEDKFYLFSNDKFIKDLGVCSLRIIPSGAQKINLTSLPKGFLLKAGLNQLLHGLFFIIFELRGLSPIFDMHTDSHDPVLMNEFNPEGWRRFYIRVAELLKMNTNIIGIFGISWFFDPQLTNISPRLRYLKELVTINGGEIFFLGSSEHGIRDAISKSSNRLEMYNSGLYTPKDYLIIWTRKSIIEWADKQKSNPNLS
jgi:hypothetical protein